MSCDCLTGMSTLTAPDFARLTAPFSPSQVQWRLGRVSEDKTRGQALPYLDARDVQARLDNVLTPAGWKVRYVEVLAGTKPLAVRCALSVRIDGEWLEKEDAAQVDMLEGSGEGAREMAIKGAYTDAFKRAAVTWGLGRHLYSIRGPWVELAPGGGSPRLPFGFDGAVYLTGEQPGTEEPACTADQASVPQVAGATRAGPARDERASATTAGGAESAARSTGPASPTPAPTPAAMAALTEEQQELMKSLRGRIATMGASVMLRSYINGPKVRPKLPPSAVETLLTELDAAPAPEKPKT